MDRGGLAMELWRTCLVEGEVRLRSGQASERYFDAYQLEAEPELAEAVARALCELVPGETEVLAGVVLAGVVLTALVSHETRLPIRLVRPAAKAYGTGRQVEGGPVAGLRVTLVEGVVITGGALLASALALRAAGGIVTDAVCVLDRDAGGSTMLARQGITLHALYTLAELGPASS